MCEGFDVNAAAVGKTCVGQCRTTWPVPLRFPVSTFGLAAATLSRKAWRADACESFIACGRRNQPYPSRTSSSSSALAEQYRCPNRLLRAHRRTRHGPTPTRRCPTDSTARKAREAGPSILLVEHGIARHRRHYNFGQSLTRIWCLGWRLVSRSVVDWSSDHD